MIHPTGEQHAQQATNNTHNNDRLSRLSSALHPTLNGPMIRPIFRHICQSTFRQAFIADSVNSRLNTLFHREDPTEATYKHDKNNKHKTLYPDDHPFSGRFFDGELTQALLKAKCNMLCSQIISALTAHLNHCDKLSYFSETGKFRHYLLEMSDNPSALLPLLNESAAYARMLVSHLEDSTATPKHVEEVLAIFPPDDHDDYQCINGTRARLVEALQFFNRNFLDTPTSLPLFLKTEVSHAVHDYIADAVVAYKLREYVDEEYEIHLVPMLTAYLAGRESISSRDGYALVARNKIPAKILYKIIHDAPNALKPRCAPLTAAIAQSATTLLTNIERCHDFTEPSTGLKMHAIREASINELMQEYTRFDPTGEDAIELDADSMPKAWKIEAIEKTVNDTLSRYVLNSTAPKTDHQGVTPYHHLFQTEAMGSVVTQLVALQNQTHETLSTHNALTALHVMTTTDVGGSLFYAIQIIRHIGVYREAQQGPKPSNTPQDHYDLGMQTLRTLAQNRQRSALTRDRLNDIIETVHYVVEHSLDPNNEYSTDPRCFRALLCYLENPNTVFQKPVSNCTRLIDDLIRANVSVEIWRDLLDKPPFLEALSNCPYSTLSAQPHPDIEGLLLLFKEKAHPDFFSDFLAHLIKCLVELNDIETIERITHLDIDPKLLLGKKELKVNTLKTAAIYNRTEVIRLLHKIGLTIDELLSYGSADHDYSITEWATLYNQPEIIYLLSELGATPKQLDPAGETSLLHVPPPMTLIELAATENSVEALEALIHAGLSEHQLLRENSLGERPHYIAAEMGHADILHCLGEALPSDALFTTQENYRNAALVKAAILGGSYGPGNDRNVIETLFTLDTGRKWVNRRCRFDGKTPLAWGILNHKHEAVEAMIDQLTVGELLTPCCNEGRLPSHYAILAETSSTSTYDALIALANKVAQEAVAIDALIALDKSGLSPLHMAAEKNQGDAIRLLSSKGMSAQAFSIARPSGESPIHTAAQKDSLDALQAMVECGATTEQLTHMANDSIESTPIKIAQKHNNHRAVNYIQQVLATNTQ